MHTTDRIKTNILCGLSFPKGTLRAFPPTRFQPFVAYKHSSTSQLEGLIIREKQRTSKEKKKLERGRGNRLKVSKKLEKPEVIQGAVKDQNIEVLRRCLLFSEDLKRRKENMLMLACMYKGKKLLDTLIAQGADTNYTNAQGCAPLHYCCVNDFSRGAITLLDHGANIHIQEEMGLTPLHQAALSNTVKCVSVLLAYGADPERGDIDDDRPLHTAARMGSYEAAVLLLDSGANVNSRNAHGETPLHCAAAEGKQKMVQLLIDRGALLNLLDKDGMSALHHAARNEDDSDCVGRLVKAGAEVNDTVAVGVSPLHLAAYTGNIEAVDALVRAGAVLDYKGSDGWTPLMLSAQEGHIGVVSYLLREGAKIDIRNDEGLAALHLAVPYPAVVRALLLSGADVNIKDNNRLTPLHIAAQSPDDKGDVVQILLDMGADQESATPEEGLTALHLAAAAHNVHIVEELLNHGADVNLTTRLGETALHFAVETQDEEFVEALCRAGAATTMRGRRGTPQQLAEKLQAVKIMKVLAHYENPISTQV